MTVDTFITVLSAAYSSAHSFLPGYFLQHFQCAVPFWFGDSAQYQTVRKNNKRGAFPQRGKEMREAFGRQRRAGKGEGRGNGSIYLGR